MLSLGPNQPISQMGNSYVYVTEWPPNPLACDPGMWPLPRTKLRELFLFPLWPLLTFWGWEAH